MHGGTHTCRWQLPGTASDRSVLHAMAVRCRAPTTKRQPQSTEPLSSRAGRHSRCFGSKWACQAACGCPGGGGGGSPAPVKPAPWASTGYTLQLSHSSLPCGTRLLWRGCTCGEGVGMHYHLCFVTAHCQSRSHQLAPFFPYGMLPVTQSPLCYISI
jgi:hypothetical protein